MSDREKKPKKADLYYRMCRHMNGYEAGLRTNFPREFVLLEQSEGVYLSAEIMSPSMQTVKFVTPQDIRRSILQWVWENAPNKDWHWTVDDAKKCLDMWLDITTPMPMPEPVAFWSEQKWCFLKHSFNPNITDPTPIFDEIISRMSNSKACMAFIGSLFSEGAKQQQYLWLKGSGQDSKGCLTRLLKKMLGPACRSANPPSKGQNPGFWLDNIMKAKCVVFNDINDRAFITTGLGKSLTGGDIQSCERKYGASYDAIFEGKLIFTSNWTPDISSEHSDQRRIIYCELDEKSDKTIDPAYEAKLLLEAPAIIGKCLDIYKRTCPRHEPIPTDNTEAIQIASENEEDYELFMERFNVVGIDYKLPLNQNKFIKETDFTSELRSFFRGYGKTERDGFKKWLKRRHGDNILFKPIRDGGVTKRCIIGIAKRAHLISMPTGD